MDLVLIRGATAEVVKAALNGPAAVSESRVVIPGAVKALDTDMMALNLLKATEERRYTLGVAYPAMKVDVAVAQDGHKDFTSPEVLEKTAWTWLSGHGDINMFHRGGSEGHATPVESYIYRGPDWHVESPVDGKTYVVKAGDWMLGSVWDEYGWELVKAKLSNGWSPEGGARRVRPDAERILELRS